MLDRIARNTKRMQEYRVSIMSSLALSLFVIWGGFMWWPLPDDSEPSAITYDVYGQELIAMEEVTQTRQVAQKPPPPPPVPPVVVPDDVVLEEIELQFQDDFLATEEAGSETVTARGESERDNTLLQADSGPKPVRIVQPDYPTAARRRNVRAEVIVEVLVDERGQVSEIAVIERFLLNKDQTEREAVDLIGYGIEEAAEAAAGRWMFRPARERGKIVRSYTRLTFSFGV